MVKRKLSAFLCLTLMITLVGCSSPSKEIPSNETSQVSEIFEEETVKKEEIAETKESNSTEKATENIEETTTSEKEVESVKEEKAQEVSEEKEQETPTQNTQTINTSTTAVTGTYYYEEAKKTLDLVNNYRKENGLSALTWSEDLAESAKIRAAEASLTWAHTRPNGQPWYTVSNVIKGENLAKGYNTAQDAFNGWLASDGHRENILWPDFKTMYVAFFETSNGWFWAQAFGY